MKASEIKKAREIVEDFLARLGVKAEAKVFAVEEYLKVEISGEDSPILIGFHGDNLKALKHLLSLVIRKEVSDDVVVSVDVSGYLERKEGRILGITKKAVARAKREGKPVELPPMNAYERRLAHSYITEQGLVSESSGQGPERHIVIKKQ